MYRPSSKKVTSNTSNKETEYGKRGREEATQPADRNGEMGKLSVCQGITPHPTATADTALARSLLTTSGSVNTLSTAKWPRTSHIGTRRGVVA